MSQQQRRRQEQEKQQQQRNRSVNDFDTIEDLKVALESPHARFAFTDTCTTSCVVPCKVSHEEKDNTTTTTTTAAAAAVLNEDEEQEQGNDEELDWMLTNYNVEESHPQSLSEELKRLACLKSYMLLDSADRESSFERLTAMATRMFGVPIALVSLVDLGRQWFMSNRGLPYDVRETPRRYAFCAHAIQSKVSDGDVFIINDALHDNRFKDNPLVTGPPHIRFYAGAPLVCPTEGYKLGTFCIIDTKPKQSGLSLAEKQNLLDMAQLAIDTMVERKKRHLHYRQERSQLIRCTAHDLLTPLHGVQLSLSLLADDTQLQSHLNKHQHELLMTATNCTKVISDICQAAMNTKDSSGDDYNKDSSSSSFFRTVKTTAAENPSPRSYHNNDGNKIIDDGDNNRSSAVVIDEFVHNIQMVMDMYPKRVPLSVTVDDNVPPVVLVQDDWKVFRSTINYLTNACNATQQGCIRLHISVAPQKQQQQSQAQAQQHGDITTTSNRFLQLLMECSDTGTGIPLNLYPLLFRPFRRKLVAGPPQQQRRRCQDNDDDDTTSRRTNGSGGGGITTNHGGDEDDDDNKEEHSSSFTAATASGTTTSNSSSAALGLYSVASQIGSIVGGDYGFRPRRQDEPDAGSVFWFSIPVHVSPIVNNKENAERMTTVTMAAKERTQHEQEQERTQEDMPPSKVTTQIQRSVQLTNGVNEDELAGKRQNLHASSSMATLSSRQLSEETRSFVCDKSTLSTKEVEPVKESVSEPVKDSVSTMSQEGAPHSPASPVVAKTMRVRCALVIDDSVVIRKSLGHALSKLGFHVTSAVNGLDGLKDLQAEAYDVVFCDFLMPIMDGLDCVQQYRNWETIHRPWIRQYIVGISAHASQKDIDKGLSAGMDAFKPKPISLQVLKELEGSQELKRASNILDSVLGPTGARNHSDQQGEMDNEAAGDARNDGPVCLVGQDSLNVSKSMRHVIMSKHWNPIFVNDGHDALRLLKTRNWDAVFLDEDKPGLDGRRVIERFREWESENRVARQKNVVLMSQSLVPNPYNGSMVLASCPNGFDGALGKPILPAQLIKLLDRASISITKSSNSCDIVTR